MSSRSREGGSLPPTKFENVVCMGATPIPSWDTGSKVIGTPAPLPPPFIYIRPPPLIHLISAYALPSFHFITDCPSHSSIYFISAYSLPFNFCTFANHSHINPILYPTPFPVNLLLFPILVHPCPFHPFHLEYRVKDLIFEFFKHFL